MSQNAPRWALGELDSSDPNEPYIRLLMSPVTDAVCKSIMTNDPNSGSVLSSPAAMADMIEAREWLMSPVDTFESRNYYLSVLSISTDALIAALRHLWRRQAPGMGVTIRKHMKPARGTIKRPTRPSKTNRLAHEAMGVLGRSNRWAGV